MHGTGDDDSKDENWMKWIAEIWENHGAAALTVPGPHSGGQGSVADNALGFMMRHLSRPRSGARPLRRVTTRSAHTAAITGAGGTELPPLVQSLVQDTQALQSAVVRINTLGANRRPEDTVKTRSAIGIKFRVAVAGVCAAAYVRHHPNPQPIRIIGHSRGGAAAVGLHNLLTLFGIPCENTLTLDPCHGQDMFGSVKDYYTKIWVGSLVNLPCVKEVADGKGGRTRRPPIEKHSGHALSCSVTNLPKLADIKHGHMGKLTETKTKWKLIGPSESAQKETQRALIAAKSQQAVSAHIATMKEHLEYFFRENTTAPALVDKRFIHTKVVETLTKPTPPPIGPD